ncbi:MAG: phytoene dehydrogenase-like protein [Cognaticolwellia sp.]|jgi:phytoene dehydrogenase-like protein
MTTALVIGGGLAGLLTSIQLANQGIHTTLLEPSTPGGRARSRQLKGQTFNLGPHALYCKGHLMKILEGLGLKLPGGDPLRLGSTLWMQGAAHPLPGSLPALLTHPVLAGARVKTLMKLAVRPKPMDVATWLSDLPALPRSFMLALLRLSTYAPTPETLSAPAAFDQLQLAQGGVLYLHGGWQSLIDALLLKAQELGVILLQERALSVQPGVVQSDLATHRADEVIVATSAPTAQRLMGRPLTQQAVTAACLCLGFEQRPDGPSFCLDLQRPFYGSMHSDSAQLGTGAVLHLMHYGCGKRQDLEHWADSVYPQWRQSNTQRWLPALQVSHGLLRHGIARPESRLAPGLLLAGDYVGPAGMLADASAASAKAACLAVLKAQFSSAA